MVIHRATGSIFALKKIPKEIIKTNFMIDQFILEAKIQNYLEHPYILKIYGLFDDNTHIYLIL
jgi:serine/threonine protein kinase